jgi:hypothetical protein
MDSHEIAFEGCASGRSAHFQLHAAIGGFVRFAGNLANDREEIELFLGQRSDRIVEFRNFVQFADERDDSGTGALGFLDHFAVPVAERMFGVALQHSQVPSYDRHRGSEFVHGKREQLRVRPCQQNAGVLIRHGSSLAHRHLGTRDSGLGTRDAGLGVGFPASGVWQSRQPEAEA